LPPVLVPPVPTPPVAVVPPFDVAPARPPVAAPPASVPPELGVVPPVAALPPVVAPPVEVRKPPVLVPPEIPAAPPQARGLSSHSGIDSGSLAQASKLLAATTKTKYDVEGRRWWAICAAAMVKPFRRARQAANRGANTYLNYLHATSDATSGRLRQMFPLCENSAARQR